MHNNDYSLAGSAPPWNLTQEHKQEGFGNFQRLEEDVGKIAAKQLEIPFSVTICHSQSLELKIQNVKLNDPRFSGLDLKKLIVAQRPYLSIDNMELTLIHDNAEIRNKHSLKSRGVQEGDLIEMKTY